MRLFALVLWLSLFSFGRAQLANDDWCGRGSGVLLDAWTQMWIELEALDAKGLPLFRLEPVTGAFAHITGIMDDRKTILHVHSHGESPREHERSGPEVPFRLVAPKTGYLKLFVQTQINGQRNTAAFTFPVE
jgi:hypothetical protein